VSKELSLLVGLQGTVLVTKSKLCAYLNHMNEIWKLPCHKKNST